MCSTLTGMKTIKFTLSAAGKNLGSFTLDPYTQLRLMADAKVNKKLTLPEYVRETVRQFTLRDDYKGNIYCADEADIRSAIADELAAQRAS
jgi:hypothetical protein